MAAAKVNLAAAMGRLIEREKRSATAHAQAAASGIAQYSTVLLQIGLPSNGVAAKGNLQTAM